MTYLVAGGLALKAAVLTALYLRSRCWFGHRWDGGRCLRKRCPLPTGKKL